MGRLTTATEVAHYPKLRRRWAGALEYIANDGESASLLAMLAGLCS